MGKPASRLLIVVCGNANHGKDSLADAMASKLDGAARDAFAAPLKQCVHLKTGIPMWVLNGLAAVKEDQKYGAYGKTPRKLMQEEGEEARQRIGLTIWMDRSAERFLAGPERIRIISDGRHPAEEMVALRTKVGDTALVPFVRIRRPGEPVNLDHVSEKRIAEISDKEFDFVVVNDGSFDDLVGRKARQLACALVLWAQTGKKKRKSAWQMICPDGRPWAWPFESEEDAALVACQQKPPCNCGSSAVHAVEEVVFDGLIVT